MNDWPKDDWAKNLADEKKRQLQDKRFRQEKDLSDRKMFEEHALPMWLEVRKAVSIRVQQLEKELGMGRNYINFNDSEGPMGGSDNCRFTISTNDRTENVYFEKRTRTIHSSSTIHTLEIIEGNGIVWKNESGKQFTPDEIARSIVGAFLLNN
jgi:hypothetical protein